MSPSDIRYCLLELTNDLADELDQFESCRRDTERTRANCVEVFDKLPPLTDRWKSLTLSRDAVLTLVLFARLGLKTWEAWRR